MLTAAAVLLGLGALCVGYRGYAGRIDAIGRPVSFPAFWVSVLIVLAVIAATPGVVRFQLEQRLSAVASAVSGRAVRVRCQPIGDSFIDTGVELGYVKYDYDGRPVDWTLIKRDQCNDIAEYLHSDKRNPNVSQVLAVHVLTHEAMHLAAVTNEAEAECMAVQRDAVVARLLGASPEQASALAAAYYLEIYPNMPGDYWSHACRQDGEWDEGTEDAPWW